MTLALTRTLTLTLTLTLTPTLTLTLTPTLTSTSLGDFDGTDAGVIATPTVSHRAVVEDDAFVVMASDGTYVL